MNDVAKKHLQKFPKNVIIESFLRTNFLRLNDVVLECEAIQNERKIQNFMRREKEISEEISTLLKCKQDDSNKYYELIQTVQGLSSQRRVISDKINKLSNC